MDSFLLYIVKIRYIGSNCYMEKSSYIGITSYIYSVWIPYFEPRSDNIGMYFHCYPHVGPKSLHMHIIDLDEVGPTFHHNSSKRLCINVVLAALRKELEVERSVEAEAMITAGFPGVFFDPGGQAAQTSEGSFSAVSEPTSWSILILQHFQNILLKFQNTILSHSCTAPK